MVSSKEETEELQRRGAKYTLPYFQVVRAKMILLAAEGLANDEIAQQLAARREVVSLWRKRLSSSASLRWTIKRGPAVPGFFPPEVVVHVKALACELPATVGAPLARWTCSDLASHVRE